MITYDYHSHDNKHLQLESVHERNEAEGMMAEGEEGGGRRDNEKGSWTIDKGEETREEQAFLYTSMRPSSIPFLIIYLSS